MKTPEIIKEALSSKLLVRAGRSASKKMKKLIKLPPNYSRKRLIEHFGGGRIEKGLTYQFGKPSASTVKKLNKGLRSAGQRKKFYDEVAYKNLKRVGIGRAFKDHFDQGWLIRRINKGKMK